LTGAWFSEVTHFAKDFYDAGYDVDFVSPNGGYVPLDPISLSPEMMGAEDWVETAVDVDNFMNNVSEDETTFVVINSTCGCAAGLA
ncbi:BrxA/BrxB family bacilliredoxin, partial [Staphylococcus aureus]|nr:BrxA/BrxB family bacilliredoxin [Staphylococcus aureus]